MIILLSLLLLTFILTVHEAGHAFAMVRRGVEIEEASIGLPLGRRLRLSLRIPRLPFPIYITPFLLGAYVKPSEEGVERLEQLTYKDRAVCYSAGIIANLVTGCVIVGGVILYWLIAFSNERNTTRIIVLLILSAVAIMAILGRRWLSYIMPLLGMTTLALIIRSLFISLDNVGGPIEVVKMTTGAHSFDEAFFIGGFLSVSLALINMLPLLPLDGGRIMQSWLATRGWEQAAEKFSMVSAIGFAVFFVFVIGKDIVNLF